MAEMSYKIIMKYNCSKFTLFVQNIKNIFSCLFKDHFGFFLTERHNIIIDKSWLPIVTLYCTVKRSYKKWFNCMKASSERD